MSTFINKADSRLKLLLNCILNCCEGYRYIILKSQNDTQIILLLGDQHAKSILGLKCSHLVNGQVKGCEHVDSIVDRSMNLSQTIIQFLEKWKNINTNFCHYSHPQNVHSKYSCKINIFLYAVLDLQGIILVIQIALNTGSEKQAGNYGRKRPYDSGQSRPHQSYLFGLCLFTFCVFSHSLSQRKRIETGLVSNINFGNQYNFQQFLLFPK